MLTRLRSACSQIVEVNWSRAHSFWKADVMDTKLTVFFAAWQGGKCQVSRKNDAGVARESHRIGHQTKLRDVLLIAHNRTLFPVSLANVL